MLSKLNKKSVQKLLIFPIKASFERSLFRRKVYKSLEELQEDLDNWMCGYNELRTHSGKYCFRRTPLQTFVESKHLAHEKMLDKQHMTDVEVAR